MSHLQHWEWEVWIQLAESEPDLEKATKYVEEAETAMYFRAIALVHSFNGHEESDALRRGSDRLLRIKSQKLKWPDPFTNVA